MGIQWVPWNGRRVEFGSGGMVGSGLGTGDVVGLEGGRRGGGGGANSGHSCGKCAIDATS